MVSIALFIYISKYKWQDVCCAHASTAIFGANLYIYKLTLPFSFMSPCMFSFTIMYAYILYICMHGCLLVCVLK